MKIKRECFRAGDPRIPYFRDRGARDLYTDEKDMRGGETSAGQLSGTNPAVTLS